MSSQQAAQSKASANGFGRRRPERDGGPRLENKMQSGKPKLNRTTSTGAVTSGKAAFHGSPARDRLVYLTTCLIGHPVEVQLKNGSTYTGTCYTTNVDKEFAIVLKMARLSKDVSFRGQKPENISKAPSKTLIIPGKDVVQLIAKDVSVTMDGISNELQREKQQELMIDSRISQSHRVDLERELEPWVPDEDAPRDSELDNIFDGHWNGGWNQFQANEELFGVKSTFHEELYTTKLERGPQMRELEREATRIAREIEGEDTEDMHLAEERGIHLRENFDVDEETRFSSVCRGRRVDDCGYDDTEDIMLDSRNSETFGDTSSSSIKQSADLTLGKSNDDAQVLSRSSLNEVECSQSRTHVDSYSSGSYDHARQLGSELPSKSSSTPESESRIQENWHDGDGGNDSIKEFEKEQIVIEDSHLLQSGDSQPLLNSKQDGSDKGELSPNTPQAPSSDVSSKSHGKTCSSSELVEGAVSVKVAGETQSANSHGRPSSSASSNIERIGAASVSSGPGLSPSSSVGSLSSEKSTLNPYAKEFKLNPNAKSFTPSQTPPRPPSPMSDGSFYIPTNISALPHMHGMPMGIGVGPSFTGQQPVMFNPQVPPLQTPQAYYQPGAPQYGQQMLIGHFRPVLYMPNYPPEMPYKGREF